VNSQSARIVPATTLGEGVCEWTSGGTTIKVVATDADIRDGQTTINPFLDCHRVGRTGGRTGMFDGAREDLRCANSPIVVRRGSVRQDGLLDGQFMPGGRTLRQLTHCGIRIDITIIEVVVMFTDKIGVEGSSELVVSGRDGAIKFQFDGELHGGGGGFQHNVRVDLIVVFVDRGHGVLHSSRLCDLSDLNVLVLLGTARTRTKVKFELGSGVAVASLARLGKLEAGGESGPESVFYKLTRSDLTVFTTRRGTNRDGTGSYLTLITDYGNNVQLRQGTLDSLVA